MGQFHVNVTANLVAAALFAIVAWWWIRARGGVCPLCGHFHEPDRELIG